MRSKPNRKERNMNCDFCGGFHEGPTALWDCMLASDEQDELNALAEYEAEKRSERWWEERGGSFDLEEDMRRSPFDPIWQV